MADGEPPRGVIALDQLRRAVVAIALDPDRVRQLNAGQRLLPRGLIDNFIMSLDSAWPLLPDHGPFTRIEEALASVEAMATEDDWTNPAFVANPVWQPAREAAIAAAALHSWSLAVDPFDDLPATWRRRRGKPRKPGKRKQV